MHESVTFGFAEFELDARRFELRRAGSVVMVQPKVLRLLFHLVANHERSVPRRELLDALWPGEAVTVASVKRAIAGARRALGEDGQAESSIRTVRGHGYRFVGEVRTIVSGHAQEPALAGDAQAILIEGFPGTERSAVLRELIRRARELGAVVLLAPCTNAEDELKPAGRGERS